MYLKGCSLVFEDANSLRRAIEDIAVAYKFS